MSQRELQGGCHCRSVRYTLKLPSLPLSATYCHCDDCRLTTGFYCALLADIKPEWLSYNDASAASITKYQSSTRAVRMFCSICGTHLVFDSLDWGMELSTSTLDVPESWARGVCEVVTIRGHCFLCDPVNGGLSNIMDDGLPRYIRGSKGERWTPETIPSLTQSTDASQLRGECHCRGVQFVVKRPPSDYANDDILKQWIKSGPRFGAIHCMCNDCRLTAGTPFFSWVFVPKQLIDFVHANTICTYTSNAERRVVREFCGRCGCHITYRVHIKDVLSISLAVFEQPKVENWIAFTPGHPRGVDPADETIDSYTGYWFKDKQPLSFEAEGAKHDPELTISLKRGQEHSKRFV